ncbi:hypothetical protein [Bdellovibrio bacteriovorus]|uniref:hypothetical protein n=1 Tax=Bdellovibrio bacteriovorus TaxID=959 RepID=UPI0005A211F5|nr:hypothetical protein [Bdellovibrio bacteriovorus]
MTQSKAVFVTRKGDQLHFDAGGVSINGVWYSGARIQIVTLKRRYTKGLVPILIKIYDTNGQLIFRRTPFGFIGDEFQSAIDVARLLGLPMHVELFKGYRYVPALLGALLLCACLACLTFLCANFFHR